MSRISRYEVLYEGCYAHVISRSVRKMKIFRDQKDFEEFKRILKLTKKQGNFQVFHYCLMQTHFHLAVQINNVKEFSFAMRDLKRMYTYWYHTRYKLSGPIWRERYKSLLIEDEVYLNACGEYIEDNPVKAGLVAQRDEWRYSSALFYSKGIDDQLVDDYDGSSDKVAEDLEDVQFEQGNVIGSSYFRFKFFEDRKKSGPVPRE